MTEHEGAQININLYYHSENITFQCYLYIETFVLLKSASLFKSNDSIL